MIRAVRQEDILHLVAEAAEMSIADVRAGIVGLCAIPGFELAAPDRIYEITDPNLRRVMDAFREVLPRLKGEHE